MNYTKTVVLVAIFICFVMTTQAQSTDNFNLDKTFSVKPNGTISLKSDDADVTIKGSNRSDVHVEIHYKLKVTGFSFGSETKFDVKVSEENGNLVIDEQPRDFNGIRFGSTDEDYTIRIEAPLGVSLKLDGDDEKYELYNINGKISIDADDADADLTACGGNAFNFNLDDGEITMDEGRGSLRLDVDDGQADIKNGEFSTIELDSDDGDYKIHSSLARGGTYHFDMDDGDLALYISHGGGTFNIRHDNADISTSSQFRQTLDEEHESTYKLEGGSAAVHINVDDADIKLRKVN